ncbi:MAG TPA: AsmA-like C-terminal region-containing protein [Candidatus Acidoferrales bacterium]|nr:AsmA-like C-terminal region-containing protein [Candidatus Acidoferrales bacterium]
MSKTISESTAPAVLSEASRRNHARFWYAVVKLAAVAVVCLWLAGAGISLLIRHTSLNRRLTARLEAAFGRPVQVGSYAFSLWTGPELEAYSVRVGEDPRFGYEYFLRADAIALRVRLFASLLRGHLELGAISLSHPSLNLVRNADGDWNLAEWLPRPDGAGDGGANSNGRLAAKPPVPRVYKIEVDDGRIDFKRGNEKLPFAFVGVNGTAETEGPGRWRLDLVAAPERAAVVVQDPGLLHLAGHLGGTSSRLRPAALQIDWSDASIQDLLRLASDNDFGVRGSASVSLTARTEGDSWDLAGNAIVSQLHRWDLPLRGDNPSLSAIAKGRLDSSGSRVELSSATIEMAHSSASVTGALDWTHPGPAFFDLVAAPASGSNVRASRQISNGATDGTELHVVSSGISLRDLLNWARAFHPGISDDIALAGSATLDAKFGGWPPRVLSAKFDLDRGGMVGTGMPSVRFASLAVHYDKRQGITFAPATLTIGAPANSFRIEGQVKPAAGAFSLRARGGATDVRSVIDAADKLGWNLARGWKISGPAHCDLRWERTQLAARTSLSGSVQWGTPSEGVSIGTPFLNRSVDDIRAHAQLGPDLTRVALTSARAFGTRWTGMLQHQLSDGWTFSLAGNSLSAAEVDRWLDPRWRESFLDRMLPFLNSTPAAKGAVDDVRASGNISLDEFALMPVTIHQLRGALTIDGRRIELANASGRLDGGQVSGSFQAHFDATPGYDTTADFSGVDLKELSAEFPSLEGKFAGSASAKIRFTMKGASRSDLLNSLECRGTALAENLSVANIAFTAPDAVAAASEVNDPSIFPEASAAFSCDNRKIEFRDLALTNADSRWSGAGSVDFSRNIDLRLRPIRRNSAQSRRAKLTPRNQTELVTVPQEPEYRLTGTLAKPHVSQLPAAVRVSASKP